MPLRPVKGQILRLRGATLLHHVVRTPDVYLVPRVDGELVVGATMEERGFDPDVTAGATLDLLREAWRVLPGISELAVSELGVGFRPALRDNLPAIGPTAVDGLFVATGHFRHGVMLAPITADLAIDAIFEGRTPPLLAPFLPDRLREGAALGRPA
jgi:glycine oxidase